MERAGRRRPDPLTGHPPLVVALHGHGGAPTTVAPHAAALAPGAQIVTPEGPWPAGDGFAWFDSDHHDLAAGFAVVDAAIADAAPADGCTLFGTSQGAAMALACALRPAPRPRVTAVVGVAGFLPDPESLRLDREPAGDRPAVFLWAGADDEVVPPVRVRSAGKVLARHGLDVEVVEGPGGHEVHPAALDAARVWLATLGR